MKKINKILLALLLVCLPLVSYSKGDLAKNQELSNQYKSL